MKAGALLAGAELGAVLAGVLGAVEAVVPLHAAKTIATVATNAASGDHLGDRVILGTPPLGPSPGPSVPPCPALAGAGAHARALTARECPAA